MNESELRRMNCSSGKLPFELCHAGLHAQPRQRRWYAAVVGNNALADFASAPAWAQAGMPDYVTRTDNTDQNEIGTGCGMAFLSWLQKARILTDAHCTGDGGSGDTRRAGATVFRAHRRCSEPCVARIPSGRQSSAKRSFRRSVRGAWDPAAPPGRTHVGSGKKVSSRRKRAPSRRRK